MQLNVHSFKKVAEMINRDKMMISLHDAANLIIAYLEEEKERKIKK